MARAGALSGDARLSAADDKDSCFNAEGVEEHSPQRKFKCVRLCVLRDLCG